MSEDWRPGAQADRPPNIQKIEEIAQGSIAPPSPPPSPPSPDLASASESNQDPDRLHNLQLIEQKVDMCAKPEVDAAARERTLLRVKDCTKQLERKHWEVATSKQEYTDLIKKQLEELDENSKP